MVLVLVLVFLLPSVSVDAFVLLAVSNGNAGVSMCEQCKKRHGRYKR